LPASFNPMSVHGVVVNSSSTAATKNNNNTQFI